MTRWPTHCKRRWIILNNTNMIKQFTDGLTVRDLKRIIKDWPEEDENGELTEVWVGKHEGWSQMVIEVSSLNKRVSDGGKKWADIILEYK